MNLPGNTLCVPIIERNGYESKMAKGMNDTHSIAILVRDVGLFVVGGTILETFERLEAIEHHFHFLYLKSQSE